MQVTPEWIGILSIAGGAIGAIIGIYRKIDQQGNEIKTMRESRSTDRADWKEFSTDFKKDIKHLEGVVGQMQTNLRVFINEGNEKTNERIHQMEKAFLLQIKEVHDRVDSVKDDMHEHKHEVNEKIIKHLSPH